MFTVKVFSESKDENEHLNQGMMIDHAYSVRSSFNRKTNVALVSLYDKDNNEIASFPIPPKQGDLKPFGIYMIIVENMNGQTTHVYKQTQS